MILRLRHQVLEWVLRLRIPPFVWIYTRIYRFACALVVFLLRRRPGLVAIYLSGSSAAGRMRFGLSDIDFKILLAGRRDAQEMQNIRRRFLWLRRCFPMLGPPDEKGIYFLDDLPDEYRAYPLVRLLLDSRFYQHRLLWGQDWLGQQCFPLLGKDDLKQALCWRLKEWNEKILLLLDAPSFAPPQRRYLLWKALADVGRFLSLLGDPSLSRILPRAEAVSLLAEQLPEALRQPVQALQEEEAERFLVDKMTDEQRFDLWRGVLRYLSVLLDEETESSTVVVVAHSADWDRTSDPHWQTLRQLAPAGADCTLADFFFIPSNPLDVDGYGSFMRIVRMPRALQFWEYQSLRQAFREGKLGKEPVFVVDQSQMAHCLYSSMLDHFFVTSTSADGFLPFVNAAADGCSGYPTRALFLEGLRLRLDNAISQLSCILESPQIARMGRERLLRFFFSSFRILYLAAEIPGKADPPRVLHLPGGPETLINLLAERGLENRVASFMRAEARAFHGSMEPVSWPSLKNLIEQGIEVAAHRLAWKDLALTLEDPLTISLILVTRNRAGLLERCLNSVRAQLRPPDELVVVDNGSTDDTAGVVRRFQAAYPVRYVTELQPGVGRARVAGCNSASGDILAFIDDDAVAEPGWLAALEECFYLDPCVGIVGGRIDAFAGDRLDWVSRAFSRFGEG